MLASLFTKLDKKSQSLNPAIVLGLAAISLIALFTLRDHGVFATIMWDEWEYDRYARLLPPAASDVPYYLYYYVYGLTKFCGDHFIGCAQMLNALFFSASLPFLYLVCRRTASQNLSLFVAMASVLGGISVYATHFMPEPMYFFGFWVGVWALFNVTDRKFDPVKLGIGVGCALAILSLIKLHAIFLIPGLLIYFFIAMRINLISGGWRQFFIVTALMLVSFFIVRFGLGYLIAGKAGFNIFGTAYGTGAQATLASNNFMALIVHALPYLLAHTMVVVTLYAVPCLLALVMPWKAATAQDKKLLALRALAISLLPSLLVITALYTSQAGLRDPEIEGAGGLLRLHMRYYNFLLPLFVMIAAAFAGRSTPKAGNIRKFIPVFITAIIIVIFIAALSQLQLSVSDGPELRGFATVPVIAYGMAAVALISVILWARDKQTAAKTYIFLFFPLLTVMGAGAAFYSAHKEKTPNTYHRSGLFVHEYLKADIAKLAIVGSDYAGVYQAMIYADDPNITPYGRVPEHSCLTFIHVPNGKEWMLLVGDYVLPPDTNITAAKDGYVLVHTPLSIIEARPCAKTGSE